MKNLLFSILFLCFGGVLFAFIGDAQNHQRTYVKPYANNLYDSTSHVAITPQELQAEQTEVVQLALVADAAVKVDMIEFKQAQTDMSKALEERKRLIKKIRWGNRQLRKRGVTQDSLIRQVDKYTDAIIVFR